MQCFDQPHFDYASSAWYPNLQKKLSNKFCKTNALSFAYPWETDMILGLASLRKSIGFQLELDSNKLLQNNKLAPKYTDEIFTSVDQCNSKTRCSSNKLLQPYCNSESGYKAISFLGPKLWNTIPIETKTSTDPSSCKHKVKVHSSRNLLKKMMIVLSITNYKFLLPLGKCFNVFDFLS